MSSTSKIEKAEYNNMKEDGDVITDASKSRSQRDPSKKESKHKQKKKDEKTTVNQDAKKSGKGNKMMQKKKGGENTTDQEVKKAGIGMPRMMPEYGEDDDDVYIDNVSVARNEAQQQYPGAVSVPGIGGDGGNGDLEEDLEAPVPNSSSSSNERNTDDPLITAYVVEEGGDNSAAVSPPPPPEAVSTTTSNEPVYLAQEMNNRRKNIWKMAIAGLLVVLIGVVAAVAVILAKPSSDSNSNQSNDTLDEDKNDANVENPSIPSTSSPAIVETPSPTIVKTPNPTVIGRAEDFDRSYSTREYYFHGDSFEETTKAEVSNVQECKEFCANFEGAYYSTNTVGESCFCFAGIDCLVRYDDGLDIYRVASGTIFTKGLVASCTYDYCGAFPDDWLCLTQYKASLRSYTLHQSGGFDIALDTAADSENNCLLDCAKYDGARYAASASGGPCACFTRNVEFENPCALPWGDQVDRLTIASGSIFVKEDIATCSFDWCDANPNHWFCLTENTLDLRTYALDPSGGFNLTKSSNANSQNDCLEFCQEHDACRYATNVNGDKCLCYDEITDADNVCAIRWGDQVDRLTIASGTLFFKQPTTACSYDWCDANPNHWFCLTENTLDLRTYALDPSGGFNLTKSSNANSQNDCLEFCQEHDACRYATNVNGDKCLCYDEITDADNVCAIRWGDQVDRLTIASGTLFFKQPTTACSYDWCDANPNHWFCLTKNTLDLRTYALDPSGGFNLTKSSNANSQNDCLEFCQEHDACRYATDVNGDKCLCYDEITDADNVCAIRWGDQVDRLTIASGTLFFKQPTTACSYDWCDANPNHWFCLTENTLQLRDYFFDNLGGFNLTKSSNANSQNDCLEFCQEHDACRYATNVNGDKCLCYDESNDDGDACVIPLGNEVDKLLVASGTLFFKRVTAGCSFTWCEAYPDSEFCSED